MTLGLLLPAGLLALLALAIPLLLHLVRQTEQKRMEFAALRWLVARAQPRRRPRFNEWLLLALRLLLLTLLALWLAQPVLDGRPDLRPWVVVDPTIDAANMPPRTSQDAQWHWLAPGFPSIDTPTPRSTASISSLLRELDADLPSRVSLTAIVPEQFDATDARQIRLGRAITWTPVAGTSAFSTSAQAKPMRIAAYADAAHQAALPYLRATATAWAGSKTPRGPAHSLREIPNVDALHPDDTHLLWLARAAVTAQQRQWVRDGGVTLIAQDSPAESMDWQNAQIAWRDVDGTPLALRLTDGKGAWVRMLVPFAPQSLPALLEPGFPDALREALQVNSINVGRAWADSVAPVIETNYMRAAQAPRQLGELLALLIALLFSIERWLAMSMRRFHAA